MTGIETEWPECKFFTEELNEPIYDDEIIDNFKIYERIIEKERTIDENIYQNQNKELIKPGSVSFKEPREYKIDKEFYLRKYKQLLEQKESNPKSKNASYNKSTDGFTFDSFMTSNEETKEEEIALEEEDEGDKKKLESNEKNKESKNEDNKDSNTELFKKAVKF